MENHYAEFDSLRNCLIEMYLENRVRLVVTDKGSLLDAEPIYNLKSWEMEYGLTEEEWAPLYARIMEYRAANSTE